MKTQIKTPEELIKEITIIESNLEYIMKTGQINGSLMMDIIKAIEAYHAQYEQSASLQSVIERVAAEKMCKPPKAMKTYEAINILKRLNNWRKGADIPQPDPKEITEAIDFAIRKLEKIKL